jgi:glycine cleavage system H protein
MDVPEDLRYTAEHEWARRDGDSLTIGITDFAQDALGDVVYVTLPEVGAEIGAGAACGEVESTKSVSDIYAPVAGVVREVNTELESTPELVNQDPYGEGWMFRVEPQDANAFDGLIDAAAYRALTEA